MTSPGYYSEALLHVYIYTGLMYLMSVLNQYNYSLPCSIRSKLKLDAMTSQTSTSICLHYMVDSMFIVPELC